MELFPLRYLIFKWRVFGAGLQLQLGGFGGMDYSLRTTNPAPRSTNLGITKLGLSLPEFPRFLRPTIPASYVLWGKFSINRSCQTRVFNVLYRLVIFTIFLRSGMKLLSCLRFFDKFVFFSFSLSRYGLSYSRLLAVQHGPREVGKSPCRWSGVKLVRCSVSGKLGVCSCARWLVLRNFFPSRYTKIVILFRVHV